MQNEGQHKQFWPSAGEGPSRREILRVQRCVNGKAPSGLATAGPPKPSGNTRSEPIRGRPARRSSKRCLSLRFLDAQRTEPGLAPWEAAVSAFGQGDVGAVCLPAPGSAPS